MKKAFFSVFAFIMIFGIGANAQTTLTTTSSSYMYGAAGGGVIVFGISNTNAYSITITDFASMHEGASTATYTLWYKATPLTGAPGAVTSANGWTQVAGPVTMPGTGTSNSITNLFSGLSFTIPANTIYRVALVGSGDRSPYYVPSGGGPNSFSLDGVEILTQDNATSPSYAGTNPTGAPTNTPRGFLGAITFVPNTPCSTPVGGDAIRSTNNICAGSVVTLGLQNNSAGTGHSFVWESGPSSTGPFTPFSTSSSSPAITVTPATTTWYRAAVTCGATTVSSAAVQVTVRSPLAANTYTINNTLPTGGTNFTSFTDAFNAMACGIAGPVTFNVSADQVFTENPPALNASGSVAAPIIFQKAGTGSNPVINPANPGTIASSTTLGAHGDAVIVINGGDYITFDAIDINTSSFNTSPGSFEYGYYLKKQSNSNACKNVTIKNSVITLSKTIYSFGIFVSNYRGSELAVVNDAGGTSENIKISGNTIDGTYSGIQVRGQATSGFYDNNIEIGVDSGNIISNYAGGATTAYGIYVISATNVKIAKNTISNATGHTTTLYGINTGTATNANIDIYANTVTLTGGGATADIYAISNASGGTGTSNSVKIYDNIITGCTYTTATTGAMYAIDQGASAYNLEIYGNHIHNNTHSPTTTGAFNMIYQDGAVVNSSKVYNNIIENNTRTSGTTGAMNGIYHTAASASDNQVYGNKIRNNSIVATSAAMTGIQVLTGNSNAIYNNEIAGLTLSNGTSGTVSGITIGSGGITNNVYNNFISDLNAPASTATSEVVRGINITSTTANSTQNVWHNTVYLNAANGGTNFGTAALYHTGSTTVAATTSALNLFNNILVNESIAKGTGYAAAYRRSTTGTGNFNSADNNLYYTGSGTNQVVFYNGTNAYADIATYKAAFTGKEIASISELPPFVNIATVPYDLHISTTIATQVESGGTPLAGVTTDYDGNTRHATKPDIGADEFAGIPADLTPPAITYTPLLYNCNEAVVALNGVEIVDQTGVPVTGALVPRIYYRKNNGTWYSQPGTLASGTGQNGLWNFNIVTADMGGTVTGDSLHYYVIAQDTKSTANIGSNPVGVTATNVNTVSVAPPVLNSLYIGGALSGNYTVGATGTFKTLTQAVRVYNASSCINSPVTFTLTDADYSSNESFPVTILDNPAATVANTLTIKAAPGVAARVHGSMTTAGSGLIKLLGADHVTLDSFTVEVTGTATTEYGYAIQLADDADSNTIKRCTIIATTSPATAASSAFSGIVVNTSTVTTPVATGNSGCDYNTITGNTVTGGYAGITVVANGVTNSVTNNTISKNEVKDFYTYGIHINGAVNTVIDSNDISRASRSSVGAFYGIYANTGSIGAKITRNRVHNTSDAVSSSTTAAYGIYQNASDGTASNPNIIANNFVYAINSTATQYGIYSAGSDTTKVYHNSVLLDGPATSSATYDTRAFYQTTAATGIEVKNNIFVVTRPGIGENHVIYFATATSTFSSNSNDLYITSTTGSLNATAFFNSIQYTTLASWQAAPGNPDASSQAVDPLFISNTDLHLQPGSPLDDDGAPTSITNDIDGDTRNNSTPDVGADEMPPPTGIDIKVDQLVSPAVTIGCYNTENLSASIKNNSINTIDFTTNPVTVTIIISGASTGSYSTVVNTGTLASNALLTVPMTVPVGTHNMSASGVHQFQVTATVAGDVNTGNNTITTDREKIDLSAGTIYVTPGSFCVTTGQAVLDTIGGLRGHSSFVWQQSNTSGSGFTDITGSNNITPFTVPAASQTKYYRLVAGCGTNTNASEEDTAVYNNPQITSTVNGSNCGTGTVNLSAAGTGSGIKWYESASGGLPVGTGNNFTTPVISTTTTYYAAATNGSNNIHVGPVNPNSLLSPGTTTAITTYYIEVNVTQAVNLVSIDVFPGSVGQNSSITISQGTTTTVLHTVNFTSNVVSNGTIAQTVPVNYTFQPGTYRLRLVTGEYYRNYNASTGGGAVFPYSVPGFSITTGSNAATNGYYFLYNLQLSNDCESPRVAVTATIDNDPGCVMPVTLLSFTGKKEGSVNILDWQTATETNNAGFALERSADGSRFSSIAMIGSKADRGNSNVQLDYTYTDARPLAGNNYYRLKQTDNDGKINYSGIVLLKGDKVNSVFISNLYPNPARTEINVMLEAPAAGKVTLVITDISGRILIHRNEQLQVGSTTISLNVAALAQGSYMLKVVGSTGYDIPAMRFVKQ